MNTLFRPFLASAALLTLQVLSSSAQANTAVASPVQQVLTAKRTTSPVCLVGPAAGRIDGDLTQAGRIKRDARPSTCDEPKPFPGVLDDTRSYHYEAMNYTSASPDASCIHVRFRTDVGETPCYTNAHLAAYADHYDPDDQAANFLGDIGSNDSSGFAFTLPAGANLVLVASNTTVEQRCDFEVEVLNLDCAAAGGTGSERKQIPVDDKRALVPMVASLLLLGNLVLARARG